MPRPGLLLSTSASKNMMSIHPEIQQILDKTAELRSSLLQHPIYDRLESLPNLQRFMELHVYAVWDFMSLLKSLQREICGVSVPWLPSRYQSSTRFVNEIVLEEESDLNEQGGYSSHFELYLRSMEECGASTQTLHQFLSYLQLGSTVSEALQAAKVPAAASQFVQATFDFIDSGDLCAIASAFTFGREGLVPDLFPQIVNRLHAEYANSLNTLKFYLDRHIHLDSGQHGPMAFRLLIALCEDDPRKWQTVESAAVRALEFRKLLWDGMLETTQKL